MLKHAVLARILGYLTRKESPFRFIDTHAGAGRFDLASQEAKRSPEWREGIARILTTHPPAPVAELLRPYLEAVGPHEADGRPLSYPGSPAIAQTLMRVQDRIALCEANPDEREALIAALGRDGRLSIVGTDGYIALNAYVPPKERRGVVLIDPPFEAPDEAAQSSGRSNAHWANGQPGPTSPGARSAKPGSTPISSIQSPRSARQTSCGSNSTSATGPPARTASSRSRAPAFSWSIRLIL